MKSANASIVVNPLLETGWGQGTANSVDKPNHFNRFCPNNCLAGCTAVAMAQVLHYWRCKIIPSGSKIYNGTTINFGEEDYSWNNMDLFCPDVNNSKLIFHCGISNDILYCNHGIGTTGYLDQTLFALQNYWGMSSNAEFKNRTWLSFNWESQIKESLDNSMPVIYGGGNHAWVIDGYNNDDEFYCNWGACSEWPSNCTCYTSPEPFSLGNFNPVLDNGEEDYNSGEEAIFNLHPKDFSVSPIYGSATLTSNVSEYRVNKANCANAIWTYSSNIQSYYGGNNWIALRAIGTGSGWIEAKYNVDGIIYTSPRKVITCTP